jgi:hypothetical protein
MAWARSASVFGAPASRPCGSSRSKRGNWFVDLTPEEADALAERLVSLVQEFRARPSSTPDADRALVSITVLPWRD